MKSNIITKQCFDVKADLLSHAGTKGERNYSS